MSFYGTGDPNYTRNLTCNGAKIKCINEEKFLGVEIDDKLAFVSHLGSIIKRVKQKLHMQSRVRR